LFRRRLNPFAVYTALLVVLLAWWTVAAFLSLLGPFGTLAFAISVFGASIYLSKLQKDRQLRIHAGMCGDCGYDLRASPDRCPECGAAVPEEILRRRRIAAAAPPLPSRVHPRGDNDETRPDQADVPPGVRPSNESS
jgi:hypothetical protein